jgi:serine/threonine protein kinase
MARPNSIVIWLKIMPLNPLVNPSITLWLANGIFRFADSGQKANMDHVEQQQIEAQLVEDACAGASQLSIGQLVADKYRVVEQIGLGGMGVVYKVEHLQLKRPFALKLMLPGPYGFDKGRLQRFDQEAKAASVLHHQNLVGIHDYGSTADGAPYVVMDYVEGRTVDVMLKDGPVAEADAIEIAIQLCDGLEYAHGKTVVHRDIKPSNIIVSTENGKLRARILDFGIAKVLDPKDEQSKVLTQTGEVVGSPQYMSPEQCMGYKLDGRTDIYSLGCVLFEMLTGRKVFVGDAPMAVMYMHLNERAPLFRTVNGAPKVRSEVERVVLQMLEKDPDSRYQNADDLKKDFLLVKSGKNPVKEVSQARQRFKSFAAAAKTGCIVLVGALLMLGAINLYNQHQDSLRPQWMRLMAQANQQLTAGHNLEDAELLFRKALKEAEKSGESPDVREDILIQLSRTCSDRQEYRRAWDYAVSALSISETHPENARRASILDAIVQSYLDLGDGKDAVDYAEWAVKVRRNTLPADHLFTVYSLSRLGQSYRAAKQYAKAEATDREALSMAIRLDPSQNNKQVADNYTQLANVLADQKRYKEAVPYAQQAVRINKSVRGDDHPLTAKSERNLKLITAKVQSQ